MVKRILLLQFAASNSSSELFFGLSNKAKTSWCKTRSINSGITTQKGRNGVRTVSVRDPCMDLDAPSQLTDHAWSSSPILRTKSARPGMPRRQTRPAAVQSAHDFVQVFIAPCSSDDRMLPKNGKFSCAQRPACARLTRAGLRLCRQILALPWLLPHTVAPSARQGRRHVGRRSDACCPEQDGRPLLPRSFEEARAQWKPWRSARCWKPITELPTLSASPLAQS